MSFQLLQRIKALEAEVSGLKQRVDEIEKKKTRARKPKQPPFAETGAAMNGAD